MTLPRRETTQGSKLQLQPCSALPLQHSAYYAVIFAAAAAAFNGSLLRCHRRAISSAAVRTCQSAVCKCSTWNLFLATSATRVRHPVCCSEGAPGSSLHLQQQRFLASGDDANATAEQPVWFVPLRLGRFSAGQDDAGADEPGQQAGEAAFNSVWLGLADSSTVLPPQAS